MKNSHKRFTHAFTIVELVVVIAVIAILSAVLIPTFSNVVKSANYTTALQNCRNTLLQLKGMLFSHDFTTDEYVFMNGDYAFYCESDQFTDLAATINESGTLVFHDRSDLERKNYIRLTNDAIPDTVAVFCPSLSCPHPAAEYYSGSAPTCLQDGTIAYAVCNTCKMQITEIYGSVVTDTKLDTIPHNFENNYCTSCNERSDATQSLKIRKGKLYGLGESNTQARITSVVIPRYYDKVPVTQIVADAFLENDFIEEIYLPDSLQEIGKNSFASCTALQSVQGMKGVTQIRAEAFYGCTALQQITLPTTIQIIKNSAFALCFNLTTVLYDGTIEQWNEIQCSLNETFPIGCSIVCQNGTIFVS